METKFMNSADTPTAPPITAEVAAYFKQVGALGAIARNKRLSKKRRIEIATKASQAAAAARRKRAREE